MGLHKVCYLIQQLMKKRERPLSGSKTLGCSDALSGQSRPASWQPNVPAEAHLVNDSSHLEAMRLLAKLATKILRRKCDETPAN